MKTGLEYYLLITEIKEKRKGIWQKKCVKFKI